MQFIKKLFKLLTGRLFISIILIIIQLAIVAFFFLEWGYNYFIVSEIIGVLIAIWISSNNSNPSYKIAWILLVLSLPVFGSLMYLLFGNKKLGKWARHKMRSYSEICNRTRVEQLPGRTEVDMISDDNHRRQSRYISKIGQADLFSGTKTTFFSLGERAWAVLQKKLLMAKHFIFIETFIIAYGKMLDRLLDILRHKVKEGVEVFLLYDDMGSINTVSWKFDRVLKSYGIHASKFNPLHPRLSARLNYRDHRKICVIDGDIAFNGGINFADEYINRSIRFGHWKDTVIMLEGPGVWNYTLMFIQLWTFCMHDENPVINISRFLPTTAYADDGFVQPFGDSPLDDYNVSENAYIQMINSADRYVWITTPYLILDNEMIIALTVAAQSGIDVRIVTPHYPDKKTVFNLTQANYRRLVQEGVRIFEYSPGFIHSKVFLADDKLAIVGTANMDYRSFYLNFECGTLLMGCSCLNDIRKDFEETFDLSKEITIDEIRKTGTLKKIWRNLLNLAAPLL